MTTLIQVDKGIPIPKYNKSKYPFGEMEIGDSFFLARKAFRLTSYYGNKFGMTFISRTVENGIRIWRTK
jgi:hypothetical protein